ncbi:MAG: zeta toxin family protein [Campylobacteraceae bacterium]|nr:zeta toxin family protein [Campylobacteraceae bacterium]
MQKDLSYFTNKQLHKKFELVWKELMTEANATPQKDKTGFVLGGQPGAGKSSAASKIKEEFLNDNCVFISGDDFRKYHPKYNEINENFHEQMHEYTSDFAGQMVQLVVDRASNENYNIIVEGTFRTTTAPINTLSQLKDKGYKTGAAVVTCSKELSWQSAMSRYENDRAKGGDGRVVSQKAHDYVVSVLADNAQTICDRKDICDIFALYKRDSKETNLEYNSQIGKEFNKEIVSDILNGKGQSKAKTENQVDNQQTKINQDIKTILKDNKLEPHVKDVKDFYNEDNISKIIEDSKEKGMLGNKINEEKLKKNLIQHNKESKELHQKSFDILSNFANNIKHTITNIITPKKEIETKKLQMQDKEQSKQEAKDFLAKSILDFKSSQKRDKDIVKTKDKGLEL